MQRFLQKATFGIFVCLTLVTAGNVQAQTAATDKVGERLEGAVQKLRAACADDLAKYCSSVTPGEGRLLYCLIAHEDKISTKCDYTLYDASRNLGRALDLIEQTADVCWPDIEKHCADAVVGGGNIAQCLLANKATVASDCRTALDQFPGSH